LEKQAREMRIHVIASVPLPCLSAWPAAGFNAALARRHPPVSQRVASATGTPRLLHFARDRRRAPEYARARCATLRGAGARLALRDDRQQDRGST